MLYPWTAAVGFMIGAAAGSFVNVLVWRLPRGESIREPKWSYCPNCKARLTLPDLIPLFSFLFLGARCRHCREKVPWRYFWVEAICGSLWCVLWYQHVVLGMEPIVFFAYALFGTALVAIVFIDVAHFIIPDELNAWLLLVAALFGLYKVAVGAGGAWMAVGGMNLPAFIPGAVLGTLIFWGIAFFGRLLFRKDALGHGDIKMARAIGALFPVGLALASYALAVALGAVLGVVLILLSRALAREEAEEEGEPEAPEPPGVLLIAGLFYLLWLDVAVLFVPALAKGIDAIFYRAARSLAPQWQPPEDTAEDEFKPTPTTIPFGPYLAAGAAAVLLFEKPIRRAIQWYLEWSGLAS